MKKYVSKGSKQAPPKNKNSANSCRLSLEDPSTSNKPLDTHLLALVASTGNKSEPKVILFRKHIETIASKVTGSSPA